MSCEFKKSKSYENENNDPVCNMKQRRYYDISPTYNQLKISE